MNNILQTTKWAVILQNQSDADRLMVLYKGNKDLQKATYLCLKNYSDGALSCNTFEANINHWQYSPISFYKEEGVTLYTITELEQLMQLTKDQLPFKYFVVENPHYKNYNHNDKDWKDYIKWFNKEYSSNCDGTCKYVGFDGRGNDWGVCSEKNITRFTNNPPLFNAKEFMEILRGKSTTNMKKIIGYKVPVTMFNNEIKKDTLYISVSENQQYYYPKDNLNYLSYVLPKEIVETWEPLYEEEYKVGDWVTIVEKHNGGIGKNHGSTFKITALCEDSGYMCGDWAIEKEWIRLATQKEIDAATATVKEYDMGSFKLIIKKDGIFHKSDNITAYCESMSRIMVGIPKKASGYDIVVEDITFKKTGCEFSITKLSDWEKVYEIYKGLK